MTKIDFALDWIDFRISKTWYRQKKTKQGDVYQVWESGDNNSLGRWVDCDNPYKDGNNG